MRFLGVVVLIACGARQPTSGSCSYPQYREASLALRVAMADRLEDDALIFEMERVLGVLDPSLSELDAMRATCGLEIEPELRAAQVLDDLRSTLVVLYARLEQRAAQVSPRDPATMEIPLFTAAQREAATAVLLAARRAAERAWSDRLVVLASVATPCERERLQLADALRERARLAPSAALEDLAHAMEWSAVDVTNASANVDDATAQRATQLARRCPDAVSTHLLIETPPR